MQNNHPIDWHFLSLGVLLKVFPQVCVGEIRGSRQVSIVTVVLASAALGYERVAPLAVSARRDLRKSECTFEILEAVNV